jgi:hypothetical protein
MIKNCEDGSNAIPLQESDDDFRIKLYFLSGSKTLPIEFYQYKLLTSEIA